MKNIKDIAQVVGMFILLIVPFMLAKLWYWVFLWAYVLVGFGVFELIAWLKTGRTLSQQFGDYRRNDKLKGNAILGAMLLGWLLLLWHLMG